MLNLELALPAQVSKAVEEYLEYWGLKETCKSFRAEMKAVRASRVPSASTLHSMPPNTVILRIQSPPESLPRKALILYYSPNIGAITRSVHEVIPGLYLRFSIPSLGGAFVDAWCSNATRRSLTGLL